MVRGVEVEEKSDGQSGEGSFGLKRENLEMTFPFLMSDA